LIDKTMALSINYSLSLGELSRSICRSNVEIDALIAERRLSSESLNNLSISSFLF